MQGSQFGLFEELMTKSMKQLSELVQVRPIRTKADYEAALAEIELLFDAQPDTPEDARLEILVTLVEAYEDEHYPMGTSNPIAMIEHIPDSE